MATNPFVKTQPQSTYTPPKKTPATNPFVKTQPQSTYTPPKTTTTISSSGSSSSSKRGSSSNPFVVEQSQSRLNTQTGQAEYVTSKGTVTTSLQEAKQDAIRTTVKRASSPVMSQTSIKTPQTPRSDFTGGQGVISAATPKEAKNMRLGRTPVIGGVVNFLSGFKSTFLKTPNQIGQNLAYRDIESLPGSQGAGATLGLVGSIASFSALGGGASATSKAATGFSRGLQTTGKVGAAASKATQLGNAIGATKVYQGASSAYKVTQATRAGRFLTDLGITTVKGISIVEGTKATSRATASKEEKLAMKDTQFKNILAKGYQAESEQVSSESWYKGLAYEGVSSLISSKQGKAAFETTVREEFIQRGYKGAALESAVSAAKRQKTASGIGESLALLEISRSSEKIGRREVAGYFQRAGEKGVSFTEKQAFGKVFSLSAKGIAPAGFVEGFSQEIAQQQARGRNKNIGSAGLMGLFGAGSAGLIGGTIGGLRVNRPGASKLIEGITYITDPYEKPGDLLADATEAIARRGGKSAPVPTIFKPFDPNVLRVSTITPTMTNTKGKGSTSVSTQINNMIPGITSTPVTTSTTVTMPIPNIIPTPAVNPTPVTPRRGGGQIPIFNPVPTPITPTPTPTPTQTQIPINEQINTNVFTNTGIFTPVNIPVVTPFARVPPPMPLQFPLGGGSAGTKKGKGLTYYNELDIGLNFLKKQLRF